MKQQLNEIKQLQKIAGLLKEDYDETNLDTIMHDIQSSLETSSVLKTDFKLHALDIMSNIEAAMYEEDYDDVLTGFEELQKEIQNHNPSEYEQVYVEMLEKAIRRAEALSIESEDSEIDESYPDEEDDDYGSDNPDDDYGPRMEEEINEAAYVPDNVAKFAKRKGVSALVNKVANWAEKSGKKIRGGTAIGKNYDTLILDLSHQDGAIYIDINDETVELYGQPVFDVKSFAKVLASQIDESELNYMEDPNPIDDVPSVKLDIDDEGNMMIQLSAFFHSKDNGKIPLLKGNPALQDVVMKAIQIESQKAFRKAVHGVLGIPYGLK